MLATTWNWLVTGDPRVPQRFKDRFDRSLDALIERKKKGFEVAILGGASPDGRYFKGKYWFWLPWQEALAIQGIDAANQIVKHPKGDQVIEILCESLIKYGWWKARNGRWVVGHSVRYLTGEDEGKPVDFARYADGTQASNHYGTAFDVWSWPAVKIALRVFERSGKKELAARCRSILAQLHSEWRRGNRKGPAGFDRAAEWKAVR